MNSLYRILGLIRKELIATLKDKRMRVVLLLPPVLESILFGYAASYDLTRVPYVVLDQDRSAASQAFLAKLDGSGVFERVANLEMPAEIAEFIDSRRALLAVQIPQSFERQLWEQGAAQVQVIGDGRNSNTAGTASSYLVAIAEDFSDEWRYEHRGTAPSARLVARAWYNPQHET